MNILHPAQLGLISHTSFYMIIFLDSNDIKHDYLYSVLRCLQYAEYKKFAVIDVIGILRSTCDWYFTLPILDVIGIL